MNRSSVVAAGLLTALAVGWIAANAGKSTGPDVAQPADPPQLISPGEFTKDSVSGEGMFRATATLDLEDDRATIQLVRQDPLSQWMLDTTDPASDATVVTRGKEEYQLIDGEWVVAGDMFALGFLFFLAAPETAYDLADAVIRDGDFAAWDLVDDAPVARFDVDRIPQIDFDLAVMTGGSGSAWIDQAGLVRRVSTTDTGGMNTYEWSLSQIGMTVEFSVPPQLEG